jgi:hypothetical protein
MAGLASSSLTGEILAQRERLQAEELSIKLRPITLLIILGSREYEKDLPLSFLSV